MSETPGTRDVRFRAGGFSVELPEWVRSAAVWTIKAALSGLVAGLVVWFFQIDHTQHHQIPVNARSFPFPLSASVPVTEGDDVQVDTDDRYYSIWECGSRSTGDGDTGPVRSETLLPNAPLCLLIGRIGTQTDTVEAFVSSQYLGLGTHSRFTAGRTGVLYFGANDTPPQKALCGAGVDCFGDNSAELSVNVTIRRGTNIERVANWLKWW